MSRETLQSYLQSNKIKARILTFTGSTITVEEAEKQLGVGRERIIKSILFMDEKGLPVLGIVTGDSMIDEEKLARACGAERLRKARPRAVKNVTGFEVGALPPIGHKKKIRIYIDPKVLSYDRVYGGGGEINALLEIDPKEIIKHSEANIVEISTKKMKN